MKLTKELRIRAIKELQAGSKPKDVATKFGITASAATYLKNKGEGKSPLVDEMVENFGTYQLDRLKRLVQAGTKLTEIAADYEISKTTLEIYCTRFNIKPAVGKTISMKMLRTKKAKNK
jgi:transposase